MRDKKGIQDAKTNQQLKVQKSIDISAKRRKKKKKEPFVAYYKSFPFGKNPFLGTHKKE